jgi:hypothetical protein
VTPKPTPTLKLPPGMAWQATDATGLGHLLPGRGAVSRSRYLCDELALPARFAWPVLRHCQRCIEKLEWGRS